MRGYFLCFSFFSPKLAASHRGLVEQTVAWRNEAIDFISRPTVMISLNAGLENPLDFLGVKFRLSLHPQLAIDWRIANPGCVKPLPLCVAMPFLCAYCSWFWLSSAWQGKRWSGNTPVLLPPCEVLLLPLSPTVKWKVLCVGSSCFEGIRIYP